MNLLLACALALLDRPGDVPYACRHRPVPPSMFQTVEAVRSATAIWTDIQPEIVLKVIYRESRFNVRARGALGEIGLMQVKRNGAVGPEFARLTRAELEEPDLNIWIGVKYMARVSLKCPSHFLSRYNGGGCRVTRYSRRVHSSDHTQRKDPS